MKKKLAEAEILAAQKERLYRDEQIEHDWTKDELAKVQQEKIQLCIGIETLVRDEVISSGKARELHGLSVEEQREFWDKHYSDILLHTTFKK